MLPSLLVFRPQGFPAARKLVSSQPPIEPVPALALTGAGGRRAAWGALPAPACLLPRPGGLAPPAARGAQPGAPISAATRVGGRRKRGTMRWQPARLQPASGLTPAATVTAGRSGVRATRQGLSPGERQKVTPSAPETGGISAAKLVQGRR